MLVELGVVEQRYRAVLEVLEDGAPVTEVAGRYGVARQTVHEWLARYAAGGLGGLADRSSRPASCPQQMPAQVEARIAGLRRDHPGWGPSRILRELERTGTGPLPGRPAVCRALIRHGLVDPKKRKRRREDCRRWERGRAMHLWQTDVMGRVHLAGGQEVKAAPAAPLARPSPGSALARPPGTARRCRQLPQIKHANPACMPVLRRAVASTYASIASVIAPPAPRGLPISHLPVTCLHDRGRGVRCWVWRAGRGSLWKEQAERHDKSQDL